MELRNRNTGRQQGAQASHDVVLGPTIYSGARYSKASERIKRQNKKTADVADASVNKLLAPQLIGFAVALVFVMSFAFWMMYQAHVKRNRNK